MGESTLTLIPHSISRHADRLNRSVFIGGGTMTGTLIIVVWGCESPAFFCELLIRVLRDSHTAQVFLILAA